MLMVNVRQRGRDPYRRNVSVGLNTTRLAEAMEARGFKHRFSENEEPEVRTKRDDAPPDVPPDVWHLPGADWDQTVAELEAALAEVLEAMAAGDDA